MPRPGYKQIQFKEEQLAQIRRLKAMIEYYSPEMGSFSDARTAMFAVRTMIRDYEDNADHHSEISGKPIFKD